MGIAAASEGRATGRVFVEREMIKAATYRVLPEGQAQLFLLSLLYSFNLHCNPVRYLILSFYRGSIEGLRNLDLLPVNNGAGSWAQANG